MKGEWNWDWCWLFFMWKRHKAPECTLVAKILKHRYPLRIKRKKINHNHFRKTVKKEWFIKVLKTAIILLHLYTRIGYYNLLWYLDVRVRHWENWSSIGFVMSIFAWTAHSHRSLITGIQPWEWKAPSSPDRHCRQGGWAMTTKELEAKVS